MKKSGILFSIFALALVATFQACSPSSNNLPPANGASPQQQNSVSGGVPYEGKVTSRFQKLDPEFCANVGDYASKVRHEIVFDGFEHRVSVQDCKSVPARSVKDEIEFSEDGDAVKFLGQVASKIDASNVGHARTTCRRMNPQTGTLDKTPAVYIYENENGLTMKYSLSDVPNFIPVAATHETGINPGETKTHHSRYVAAYANEHSVGLFRVWLTHEEPTTNAYGHYATWQLQIEGGEKIYHEGRCTIEPYQYPW